MNTIYTVIINHGKKETKAFYTVKSDAVKTAYELLTRGKSVSIVCTLYDSNRNIVKETVIY